ncbi:hypothetical protein MMC15_003942 [Xylographa vitiligo]|nr:hypothetical protein [Xylographa vitiligo]
MAISEKGDSTLHLPRILCLHGGGTNARIFRLQCRVLARQLQSTFRLCFAEAPFASQAGPDVHTVYREYGPFRRWLRWQPDHPEIEPRIAVAKIEAALEAAKREDDEKGATGEWVALLGFSQGAKMCASLLLRQQARAEKLGRYRSAPGYRFAVLLAGRGPLVALEPELVMTPALVDAGANTSLDLLCRESSRTRADVLRIPTIHVHGLRDGGLKLHRRMQKRYCERNSARVLEWDGDHRVPIKSKDVAAVVAEILDLGKQTGVLAC